MYESVLACLDINNKDGFGVDFLLAHPLEYILDETLGGGVLAHHGYMQKIGWCENHVHFYYHHSY